MTREQFAENFKRIRATWPDLGAFLTDEMQQIMMREWWATIGEWTQQEFEVIFDRVKINVRRPSLSDFVKARERVWEEARAHSREKLDVEWIDEHTVRILGVVREPVLPTTENQRKEMYYGSAKRFSEEIRKLSENGALLPGEGLAPVKDVMFAGLLRHMALAFGSEAARQILNQWQGEKEGKR